MLQGVLASTETISASKRSDQLLQQLPLEPSECTARMLSLLLSDYTF